MSDEWDYRIRRMEITWEIARKALEKEQGTMSLEMYLSKAKKALEEAKCIVETQFQNK